MKKVISLMLIAVIALLTFAGCDSNAIIRPADSLLTPPLYYDEYEGLVDAFKSAVGPEISLCNPYSGNYRSAVTVNDIDGDSQNEAVIFYKTSASPEHNDLITKMHYFDYVDGEWISSAEVGGHGDGVESVSFTDMDADGFNEIVVSWSTSSVASDTYLSLYKFDAPSAVFKEIFGENCMAYLLMDVDGDLLDDIFYVSQSIVQEVAQKTARVIGLSGDSVVVHGEAKLDPNISRYTMTVPEKRSDDGLLSVYLDALKGEGQMITEFLYWDDGNFELCNPFLNADTVSNTKTFRYETIASADINNDGKLDIPSQTPLGFFEEPARAVFSSGNSENGESVYLTTWKNYGAGGTETTVAYTLVNVLDGYMIYLDESEAMSVRVASYPSRNCWVVYSIDSENGELNEIYSVLRIKENS